MDLLPFKANQGKDSKSMPKEIVAFLKKRKIDNAAETKLREYYLQSVCVDTKPAFEAITKQVATLTKERDGLNNAIPGSFVFKDMGAPREAFVMMRGQYTKPGEKIEPNTPSFLPPLAKADAKKRATRLDLANWLTAPTPLTAPSMILRSKT